MSHKMICYGSNKSLGWKEKSGRNRCVRLFERHSRSHQALLHFLCCFGIFPRPWNPSGSLLLSSLGFVLPFRDRGMTWKKCKYKLYTLCGQAGFQSRICRPTLTTWRTDTDLGDFFQTHGNGYLY